ncbi:MAG: hypothetical protein B0D96_09235 [Candidatus Sedimenticola endophacoides]|uniref:Translocation and assembly module subunit TamA n=1 Tax=Candidatus Sedimenticola endophacoides TaxID=2548426 RepID=A0A6N4DT79_9GAMM|nr:MAG: hypothetical protein B0D94_07965 [Candidatus Sedimenticola endophacoides]OQX34456.1 MAG: hypothetical protein B0D96_09235 [Candidatus Sedimenticola endophacoides]OQX40613.1 MAG: hypothetical protein B0D89_07010 [Candidatus Sedimenticola endophacoides]PUE00553.1 MAG: outer membrane protein assembly factor [Candidatus Sedimenticola endophacoides]PUE01521.1 MAG: outer membrane protein assembly factor [Candidatus Sedimenticola endophacoides]
MKVLISSLFLLLLLSAQAAALELSVTIEGLGDDEEQNVRQFLSIVRERERPDLTPERVRYLHQRAPEQIRKALQPYGLFRPRINAELQPTADGFDCRYRIEPGQPVTIGEVNYRISGAGTGDPRLQRGPTLEPGQPLNQGAYDATRDDLLSRAIEAGYLDARYTTHELRVDLDRSRADITLVLESGPRYRYGPIRFIQNGFDPAFLRRYLRFTEGDPFEHAQLRALQTRLLDSEYFSLVAVRPLREQADEGRIPLEITLNATPANRYRIGAGFSTDVGPRLSLDWQRRRLGDQGHRLLTEMSLSPVYSQLRSEYTIPLTRPSVDSLTFAAALENHDSDNRKGDRLALSATHSLGLADDWRRNLTLEYTQEAFEIADTPGTPGGSHHLMPGIGWSHLRTDGLERVRRGHRLSYQVIGAWEPALSSSSFLQAHASSKSIFSFGDDWRLIGRLELGASLAESASDLPATRRFFAGGDNSIRGFDLDELGPKDSTGRVVGGRFLGVGSLELERRINGKWGAALFYDFGNAFDPGRHNTLAQGAGFGLRWQSPVGPVRIDLANALSEDDHPFRLHLVVGPEL